MRKLIYVLAAGLIFMVGCTQPKPVKTIANLKAGITGETTASAKYAAFADKARSEGLDTIAKLFDAASKSESIHAANHTKVLEGLGEKMEEIKPEFEVKSTAENLQAAIDGESYEVATMYPEFMAAAAEEKVEKATKSFTWAVDTEKKHAEFYKAALDALQKNAENTLAFSYVVCPVCGNTFDATKVEDKCAFCGTTKEKYIAI